MSASLPLEFFFKRCFISGCILIIFLQTCVSYNLEPRLPLFKYGPSTSTFGFSVAQHRFSTDDTSGLQDTMLVVGAPTADALTSQPRATKPGGVFYCPVSTDPDDCTRVLMDSGGETTTNIKTNQWLGVSLKSQGPGRMLVSCAHRWTQHLREGVPDEVERVCGKCFLLNATSNNHITEVSPDEPSLSPGFVSSPCDKILDLSELNTKRIYGYMQAGTSIYLHNDQYLLGAPGSWSWTGSMFDISMPQEIPAGGLGAFFTQGEANMYSTPTCYDEEKNARGTKCNKIPVKRDSYMGFSVATSNSIVADSVETFYITGAPRGNNTGAVLVFKKTTSGNGETSLEHVPLQSVSGEAIASSFGFSIAMTDIDGNGLDDLIVGAPQYYQYNNDGKYGGAVYVYQNVPGRGFSEVKPKVFYGPLDSFFGYSVAGLGDIDQDGYDDFAVGAPYENENGTVHIFRGAKDGKIKESQVLSGKDYLHVRDGGKGDITGFGSSLSGSIDADSNMYPDLLIGTLSDHVSLFRTRPIISVNLGLKVAKKEIDLEEKTCRHDGDIYTCFEVEYCFTFEARHKEYKRNLKLKYKLTLDSIRHEGKKSSRVHFDSPDGGSVIEEAYTVPRAGKEYCPGGTHEIYFDGDAKDKLSSIGVEIEVELDGGEVKREAIGADVFAMIDDPILDADLDSQKKKKVMIKNSCGTDGCQSNLTVTATMPDEIVVGGGTGVPLTVEVANDGEEAHEAFVIVNLPLNIEYDNFTVSDPSDEDIVCYPSSSGQAAFIRCDLGNPYRKGSSSILNIRLGVSGLTSRDKSIEVSVAGFTTSENPEIVPVVLQSQVIIELDISLTAAAQPEQVRYTQKPVIGESGMKTTEDIGPSVLYTFIVKNEATLPAAGVELNVQLPYEIRNGKWLLYLVSSDVRSGGPQRTGTCGSSNLNVLRLPPGSGHRTKRSPQGGGDGPVARPSTGGAIISTVTLSCAKGSSAHCIDIKCQLDEINPGSTTSVILLAHVWEATFLEEYAGDTDLVYIQTSANITTSEENVRFKGDKTSETVQTTVDHKFVKGDVVSTFPWWYILIGVIVLLIIYILIIFFLIKCGFFKRKKYHREDEDENEVHEVYAEKEREAEESNL